MKKFMLVPQSPFPSPLTKKLNQLDDEMKNILEREDVGEATKAKMYSDVLSKYLDVKKQIEAPQRVPIVENTTSEVNTSLFPPPYRNRAQNLLDYLK